MVDLEVLFIKWANVQENHCIYIYIKSLGNDMQVVLIFSYLILAARFTYSTSVYAPTLKN